MDTKLNIQLTSENSTANSAFKATTQEVKLTTEALKSNEKAVGSLTQKYYLAKEGVEYTLDGLRALAKQTKDQTKAVVESSAHWVEHKLHLMEVVEATARASAEMAKIPALLDKIKPKLTELAEETEGFIASLRQDAFLQAAEGVQVYQARLEGMSGSAEAAAKDLEYLYGIAGKATGGFSSDSIVEAGLSLKELNQDIQDTIPLAIKLAAGTGKDVNQAAIALGNSFNGLESGLSSLQRTFKLSRSEIAGAGADLDDNGNIAMGTTEKLENLRKAIIKIINLKYGDVVAKQADTIGGAFTNVASALHHLMAALGDIASKSIISFLNGMTEIIEKCREFVPVLKFVAENLYNFMTPITIAGRIMLEVVNKVADVGIKVVKTFNGMSQTGKDTAIALMSVAAAGTLAFTAIYGMLKFNLVFAAMSTGAAAAAAGVAKLAGETSLLGGFARGAAVYLLEGAGICIKMAGAATLAAGAVAALVGGGIALFMAYRNSVKYAQEEQKQYNAALDRTIIATQIFNSLQGKSKEQLEDGTVNSNELKAALNGLAAESEKAANEYENFLNTVKRPIPRTKSFGFGEIEDKDDPVLKAYEAQKEALRKNAEERKKIYEDNRKNYIEAARDLVKEEEKNGTTGQALYEKSKKLEQEKVDFEKDMASGRIQTKREEAKKTNEIYEKAVADMKHMQSEINALQSHKGEGTPEEQKENEKRLNLFTAMFQNLQQIEAEYRLKRLADNRAAIREEFELKNSELQQQIGLGKAGYDEQIKLLKEFQSAHAAELKNDVALQTQISREIVNIAFQQRRALQQLQIQTRQAERQALDSRMQDLQYEDSLGKNRVANFKEESGIIHEKYMGQIKDIKDKLALDLEANGNEKEKAEISKQANAQISALRHQELIDIRHLQEADAERTAEEIQNNIARINSQKEVLQSKMEALQDKYGRGYDNQAEIRANREVQKQRELDIIRADERARLLTEKNESRRETIRLEADSRIKTTEAKYALEEAHFEEQLQVRLAERKIALNELVIKEQENSREEWEQRVRESSGKQLHIYEEEAKFIKENLNLKLAALQLEKEAELKHNQSPDEQAKTRRKYAAEERKLRLDAHKEEVVSQTKEASAKAEQLEKQMDEQREITDEKIRTGQVGTNAANEEKKAIVDQFLARKAALEAHAKEAIAAGDVKDKERIQADTHREINKLIRESVKELQNVNLKYTYGQTALDKIVGKYERSLQILRQMEGILDSWDDEPMPTPPTEEEIKNDPFAKDKWEDKVRERRKKTDQLRKEKEKAEQADARKKDQAEKDRLEQEQVKKRREELKGEGKSGEEIRAILAEEATARRKAERQAEKDAQNGKTPEATEGPAPKDGDQSKDKQGKTDKTADTGQQKSSELAPLLVRIAEGIDRLNGNVKSGNSKPRTTAHNRDPKDPHGKSLAEHSLSEKMAYAPYGYTNFG